MAQDAVRSASEPVASIKFDIHSHQHSLETISKKGGSERGCTEWSGSTTTSWSRCSFCRRLNRAASTKTERWSGGSIEAASSNVEHKRFSPEVKVSGGRVSLISLWSRTNCMVKIRLKSHTVLYNSGQKLPSSTTVSNTKTGAQIVFVTQTPYVIICDYCRSARIPTCHKTLASKVTVIFHLQGHMT